MGASGRGCSGADGEGRRGDAERGGCYGDINGESAFADGKFLSAGMSGRGEMEGYHGGEGVS
jgi:hypothetical protein